MTKTRKSTAVINTASRRGGVIKRKAGSSKLYVDFYYFNRRVSKSTGLDDTIENRAKVQLFLDKIMQKIEERTFRFADAFPGATRKEKKLFTELEGRQFLPEPQFVNFGDYAKDWMQRILPTYTSKGKQRDYLSSLNSRILPFFRKMSFYEISPTELKMFVASLKKTEGKDKGKQLSRQRIKNILIPLRRIWVEAANKYRWNIRSPFEGINEAIPKKKRVRTYKVFRLPEWLHFLQSAPPFYRPHLEFFVMTGLSPSEMAGIRKEDVGERYIEVERSIVLGDEQEWLKNNYRFRKIYITDALRRAVDQVIRQAPDSPHLFPMEDGTHFNNNSFRKVCWNKALKASQIAYKTPYSTRHTFCAWSLAVGKNPMQMVNLMGHASKQMVYQVYGEYVEDLEDDVEDILRYYGHDFLVKPKKNITPLLGFGASNGASWEPIMING